MKRDCLFCRIADKEIPAKIVYEDDQIIAFDDIKPQAPIHVLIIPKAHHASLNEVPADRSGVIDAVFAKVPAIAESKGIKASGYRLVLNTGPDSGQDVFHLHFHLLGGRPMHWPPG
ncbi:MAG: histidine triad nucleotide-binding protein [Candidatus Aminicenantales bacterium]